MELLLFIIACMNLVIIISIVIKRLIKYTEWHDELNLLLEYKQELLKYLSHYHRHEESVKAVKVLLEEVNKEINELYKRRKF